jgi:tetraacyldisaccharide 4'-kinase
MILLRILLFPFACLYYVITQIRNRLYDQRLKPAIKFDLPVLSVGNLAVGGTGKTPMIEYLIRRLKKNYRVATLRRGYGRNTKGIRIAGLADDATTLGDEPFQFYKKFGNGITVAVGEERALAIPMILQEHPDTQIILMDDAFQHRRVVPGFSILLSDYNRPFYKDLLLPSGRLRESRWGAKRADVIIVTKCPAGISSAEMMAIEGSIRHYAERPVFFTGIRYGNPSPFLNTRAAVTQDIVLMTGIANSKPLERHIKTHYTLIKHIAFKDHHAYSAGDLESLRAILKVNPKVSIITTEKDMVKIDVSQFQKIIADLPLFYLPIEIDFIKDGKDFDEIVLNMIQRAR